MYIKKKGENGLYKIYLRLTEFLLRFVRNRRSALLTSACSISLSIYLFSFLSLLYFLFFLLLRIIFLLFKIL